MSAQLERAAPAELLYAIQSDVRLRYHSVRLAEAQARHEARTYMYLFTWRSPPGYTERSRATMELGERCGMLRAPMDAERAVLDGVDWKAVA